MNQEKTGGGSQHPLPCGKLYSSKEGEDLLRVSGSTLSRWRRNGTGPEFIDRNGLIFYTAESINKWMAERSCISTIKSASDNRYAHLPAAREKAAAKRREKAEAEAIGLAAQAKLA